jgi:hypothetical protein
MDFLGNETSWSMSGNRTSTFGILHERDAEIQALLSFMVRSKTPFVSSSPS